MTKNAPNKFVVRIPPPSGSEIHEQQADAGHDDEPNEKRKGSRNDAWIGVWYQGKLGADDEHLEGNAVAWMSITVVEKVTRKHTRARRGCPLPE